MKVREEFLSILASCRSSYAWFGPPNSGEMHDVELCYVVEKLMDGGISSVFESGVYRGRSSAVIGEYVRRAGGRLAIAAWPEVHENVRDLVSKNPCVEIIQTKGEVAIRQFSPSADYASIVDGPKAGDPRQAEGWKKLMRHFLFPRQRPKLVFNHDMRRDMMTENFRAFMEWYQSSSAYMHYDYELIPKAYIASIAPQLGFAVEPTDGPFPRWAGTNELARMCAPNMCCMTRVRKNLSEDILAERKAPPEA